MEQPVAVRDKASLMSISIELNSALIGIIITYLRRIYKVLIIGIRRYPILSAVYVDTPISLLGASLYTWLDFSLTIVKTGLCENEFYPNEKEPNATDRPILYLTYYGTGSKLLFFQLVKDIPRYFLLAYICVKLPMLLVKRIRRRHAIDRHLSQEQKSLLYSSLPYSVESRYVRNLLGMNSETKPTGKFVAVKRFIYAWRDDFRFSSRVVCVFAAVLLLLFFITVQVR